MNYQHQHLLSWLNSHSCINISELERLANLTKGSIRHFVKDRRDIAEIHFNKIEKILEDYGYKPLHSE